MYGNLILNDVATDANGNVITKTENRTKEEIEIDGKKVPKVNRQYYKATFLSLDNVNVARTITLWQTHTDGGKACIWKAINPAIASRMIGKDVSGKIVIVDLNETYFVEDNEVNSVTLFIPHEDELEKTIQDFLIQAELITEPEEVSIQ